MAKHFSLHYLILILFLLAACSGFAQRDSAKPKSNIKSMLSSLGDQIGRSVMKDKWDSTVFYAKKMEASAKNTYGEICLPHTILSNHSLHSQATLNEYKSAYYYLKRGVEISSKITDSVQIKQVSNFYDPVIFYFGMTCYFSGANNEAETYLLKAAGIYKNKRVDRYAQSMLVLACIHASRGEYAKASALNINAQEALGKVHKNAFEYYLLASGYNNQGIIYTETSNWQKALLYLKKANETEKNTNGYLIEEDIKMLLNLAHVYALNGYSDSALLNCRQAEEKLTGKKNGLLKAEVLKEKAMIFLQQNKIQQAIIALKEYKKITDTLSTRLDSYDATMLSLGTSYTRTKQYKPADSLFRKEVKKIHQSGLKYDYLMQQSLLGLCANLIAEKKYSEATDSLITLCHLTFYAMEKNFYGMSEKEKLQYKSGIDEIFNQLYLCIYRLEISDKRLLAEVCKLELQRNSLVLLNQISLSGRIRNSPDVSLSAMYNQWLSNKEILSKQYSLPVEQRVFNTDSLEDICETLEKKVSVKGYGQEPSTYDGTISSLLPNQQPMSANIEFIRFHYKTLAGTDSVLYASFIISNDDTFPAFVHLCSESQLIKIMKNKNGEWIDEDQLTQKIYNAQNQSAAEFYRLIWKPMEPYLKGAANINYTTSGMLNNIAFNALYNGRNYLMQQFAFHRLLSLVDKKITDSPYQKPQSASIWGNMNYDSASADLPDFADDTEKGNQPALISSQNTKANKPVKYISTFALQSFDTISVTQISKLFTDDSILVNSYQHEYATEDNFKKQASATGDVLHISTHGFYTQLDKRKLNDAMPGSFISGIDNPLFRCWIAFSGANNYLVKGVTHNNTEDGLLNGYEVAQLDLHNVQLLVLNACETGLGDITDNEGNIGFQRAFKIAGAKNILVSLWQVPAKQTGEMFSLFYKNLLNNGLTLSEALRGAQQTMQKTYPAYYWAGFVLIE